MSTFHETPRQQLENLLPTGFAFALKSHDPLMKPHDRVLFAISHRVRIIGFLPCGKR